MTRPKPKIGRPPLPAGAARNATLAVRFPAAVLERARKAVGGQPALTAWVQEQVERLAQRKGKG